jgi:hypothetical protein
VWEWLRGALDVEADETAGGDGGAPWRGLASYTSDDARRVSGARSRRKPRSTGCAPRRCWWSSDRRARQELVRAAGVLPALGRRAVVLRPGPAPLATLAARLGDGEPEVLVVDQLEELFTLGAPPPSASASPSGWWSWRAIRRA